MNWEEKWWGDITYIKCLNKCYTDSDQLICLYWEQKRENGSILHSERFKFDIVGNILPLTLVFAPERYGDTVALWSTDLCLRPLWGGGIVLWCNFQKHSSPNWSW